jgi:hypothetical protein
VGVTREGEPAWTKLNYRPRNSLSFGGFLLFTMIWAEPGRTDKNGIKLRYDGLVANIPIQEIMNGIGLFSEKSIKKMYAWNVAYISRIGKFDGTGT